jgi:hypothetical protein
MKSLVPLALLLAPTVLFAHDADDFISMAGQDAIPNFPSNDPGDY